MIFEIRVAMENDLDTIVEFNKAMALETENKILPHDKIYYGVKNILENPSLSFYIVADNDEKIIASLMITTEWSDWRNGLFWWIQSVYVIPEFRRKGVYRQMYSFIKTMANSVPEICGFRLYVEKENVTAQNTYKSLGMTETNYKLYEELKPTEEE